MYSNLLEFNNPWWQNPASLGEDQHLKAIKNKSYRFDPTFFQNLDLNGGDIFVLRGPRQVGKTTAIKMLLEREIMAGMNPKNILYLSCEALDSFQKLLEILTGYLQKHSSLRTLVLLDEISFISEWQRAILGLANLGLTKNAALFLTGSNARDLKESAERLPGRRGKGTDIRLYPHGLTELSQLKCFQGKSFEDLLEIYLAVGGFPRAIAEFVEAGFVSDQTIEIYRNWIIGDAQRYSLRQETLKQILFRISQTVATRITWPKLIENTPVRSHETALEYVEHLQDAFLCHLHYCMDPNTDGPAFQKARKIYFVDPLLYSLSHCWQEGIPNIFAWHQRQLTDPQWKGNLFESIVVNHAARQQSPVYYWYSSKEKREVDLVLRKGGVSRFYEIKWRGGKEFKALNRQVQLIDSTNLMGFLEELSKTGSQ